MLEDLCASMRVAAGARKFELAARLRDRFDALSRLDFNLRRFHDWANEASFVYRFDSARDGAEWWLIVKRGVIRQIVPRPEATEERQALASLLHSFLPASEKKNDSRGGVRRPAGELSAMCDSDPDQLEKVSFEASRLLFRWFRRFKSEKERRIPLAKALRLCESRKRAG